MKISVIIPVYNVGQYLDACIDSVLCQTFQDFEIIAINDGSTDNSLEILEKYQKKIRIFTQENAGLSKVLNLGISKSLGEYIAFLDGDDLWVKDKLEKQLNLIESEPHVDAVFGKIKQFLSDELLEKKDRFRFEEYPASPFMKISILIKNTAFMRFGLFADVKFGDFVEWFDRVRSLGLNYLLSNEIIAFRRIRENSMSQQNGYYESLLHILKKKIEAKRMDSY